jgi:hypothetical protein
MKNSIKIIFLFFCLLYGSDARDVEIKNFFKNLNNKTVNLEINQSSDSYNAILSINVDKIFFDTLDFDGIVSVFSGDTISSYNSNDNIIILESAEKNLLEFFNYKNFENAELIKIDISDKYLLYHYVYMNNNLLIKFDPIKEQVYSISFTQFDKILFDCFVGSIESFKNPLTSLKIDDNWQTLDWRSI